MTSSAKAGPGTRRDELLELAARMFAERGLRATTVRDIAAVIGRRLGLPVESVPEDTFGPLGPIFATDQPSSSAVTRETLGWAPIHPSLLKDLENIQR